MNISRKIELLAPAKNLECGIEAVNHGADAVYIGAPQFSARAAASNSITDIQALCDFAHQYYAKVYVALNTIIKDSELQEVEQLIHKLHEAGADAIIIQDMGILQMDLPPIAIHASTQADNRTAEKVKFLEDAGFSQVVLARELTLSQIKAVAEQTNVPLEAFIHGALCVSYSGNCYISHALAGRSANRGNCAQYCRMPYTMKDAAGRTLASNKHLLSLKDFNQTEHLEALLDAGVSSLKIEGRLKDMSYVKNITAYYRQRLDEIFARRPEYSKASSGNSIPFFSPDPYKSFNRGFTDYFISGKRHCIASVNSPKSLGEYVGIVKNFNNTCIVFSGNEQIKNGDGLCFLNEHEELQGFKANRVENDKIFPADMPNLKTGIALYRNYNHEFEKSLAKKSAERKIELKMKLNETEGGFELLVIDEDSCNTLVSKSLAKEIAQKDQTENIHFQLSKLGNTIFKLADLQINLTHNWFIPSSFLADLRRKAIKNLESERMKQRHCVKAKIKPTFHPYPETKLTYSGNVANEPARSFYKQHGVSDIEPAFELQLQKKVPLMFAKYCILFELGYCKKLQNNFNFTEPLSLLSGNSTLHLQFNCDVCEMVVKQL